MADFTKLMADIADLSAKVDALVAKQTPPPLDEQPAVDQGCRCGRGHRCEDSRVSISDDIKAAREMLAQARAAVPVVVKDAKEAAVTMVVELDKLRTETAAIRSELATLTNGGPSLDEPVGPTILPPVTP